MTSADDVTGTRIDAGGRSRRDAFVPRRWWVLAAVQLVVVAAGAGSLPGLVKPRPATAVTPSTPSAIAAVPSPAEDIAGVATAVTAVLRARDSALLGHDRARYLAATPPRTAGGRTAAALFTDIRQVPLSDWTETVDPASVRTVSGHRATFTLDVTRRYRLKGFDPGGVAQQRTLTVIHVGSHWQLVADARAPGARGELWETGPVVVRYGKASLVLAHPANLARLARYVDIADRAVRNVSRVWGSDWSQRVVIVVPSNAGELGRVLDSRADYAQIAALATADVVDSGGLRTSLADRVVINPATFSRLSWIGQRIVMTHEVTHVASRRTTGRSSPSWLVEGFADYVAYRNSGVLVRIAARDLAAQQGLVPLPVTLPTDAQFDPGATDLGATYELSWLACRFIAERTSEAKLIQFYKAVGADSGPTAEVLRRQFAKVFNTSTESFTASWRTYVAASVS